MPLNYSKWLSLSKKRSCSGGAGVRPLPHDPEVTGSNGFIFHEKLSFKCVQVIAFVISFSAKALVSSGYS